MNEIPTPPPPPPAGGAPIPWEERERLGFLTALVENLKLFVTSPVEAFSRTRQAGDYASPILFAVLVSWLGVAAQKLWELAFGSSIWQFLPEQLKGQSGMFLATSTIGTLVTLLLAPIFILCALFLSAAVVHLFLMLVGGTKRSSAGFEGTVRALSYGSVAQLANLIPFAGGIIALFWAIVLYVLGLAALHRTTQGKALAAVLLPLLLCCVCVALSFASIIAMIAAAAASASGN